MTYDSLGLFPLNSSKVLYFCHTYQENAFRMHYFVDVSGSFLYNGSVKWMKGYPMITRKDFVIIADALVRQSADRETVKVIANALALTNPNFDEDKFTLAAMNWE